MSRSAIAIAGMHRSGTSMVTRALQLSGLHLGDEADLIPPSDDNPDGYWEHRRIVELNEALLAGLGGGWDDPPAAVPGWQMRAAGADLRSEAEAVLGQIEVPHAWGWKDPRTSLTLPFWAELAPGIRTVICLRHPLEVAMSLRRRGMFSFALSLRLWQTYNARLLDAIGTGDRLVVHYEAALADSEAQLDRLTAFAGLTPSPEQRDASLSSIRSRPGRRRFDLHDLRVAGAPSEVVDLYVLLCGEAAHETDGDEQRPPAEDLRTVQVQLGRLATAAAGQHAPQELLRERVTRLEESVASLEATVSAQATALQRRLDDVQHALYRLPRSHRSQGLSPDEAAYQETVSAVRAALRERVPPGGRCLVATKGDEELLDAYGRTLAHFPQLMDGGYLGHHPAGDLAAIANLQSCRAFGRYDHLFIPAPQLWWLEHYPGFAAHLRDHHREVWRSDGVGALFELGANEGDRRSGIATAVLERFRATAGREAVLLDLGCDLDVSRLPAAATVFRPPHGGDRLPYLDRSVDVVLCRPDMAHEAIRMASSAVLVVTESQVETIWVGDEGDLPSASIIIPTYGQPALLSACLRSLAEQVPPWLDVEVIVVDDASPDDPYAALADVVAGVPGIRLLRNASNEGFLGSAMRGAEAATGEVLVFLNNDTVLLPGWLTPLLGALDDPRVGAAGGRLLYPDGTLQEAGAAVFADGSAAKVGYGDPDPERLVYEHRRVVDYCSGALLATRRDVFFEMGGFDRRYSPGFYEDTDYCTALRAAGKLVMYEPESSIVHIEGGTAGTDLAKGMKRYQQVNQHRFVERWSDYLAGQPPRPEREDPLTLVHVLARRGDEGDPIDLRTTEQVG